MVVTSDYKFSFNGVYSSTYGVTIAEQLTSVIPKMRYSTTNIDGYNGSKIIKQGYETIEYQLKINFKWERLSDIKKWLTGKGKLILPDDTEKYYDAEILDRIEFKKKLIFGEATIKFLLQPIKHNVNPKVVQITQGTVVENKGDFTTMPILTITAINNVELFVNGVKYCKLMFGGTRRTLVIDGQKQDCFFNNSLANRSMDGDFPELSVGNNTITYTGNVTSASMEVCEQWV